MGKDVPERKGPKPNKGSNQASAYLMSSDQSQEQKKKKERKGKKGKGRRKEKRRKKKRKKGKRVKTQSGPFELISGPIEPKFGV